MSTPRIAVVGTGAIGASLAADLTNAGFDVTLIEQWPDHVEAMRRYGLRVDTPKGSRTTRVQARHLCEVCELREPFDVVLLVVKAYDTRWACELIKPLLAPGGVAIGVQNGMTSSDMADVLGADRVLGAVVEIAANTWRPGVVERQTGVDGTWFGLGAPDPAAAHHLDRGLEVMGHCGTVEAQADIASAKWMKLVGNAAEFLPSAILDLPLLATLDVPGMRDVMDSAGREALDVGLARGHSMVPIFGLPGLEEEPPERFAAAILDAICHGWATETTRVALLQDWGKGRRGEVDAINGLVVDAASRLGLQAPVNALLVDVAHRVEAGELEAGPGLADLLVGERAAA